MARRPRLSVPGETQHVIQRGNNRAAIFFDDLDRQLYLAWLDEALRAQGCALHAYVLMTNHVHLLLTIDRANSLPRAFQSLGRRYVRHINRRYRRSGTLWEGRYRSTIIDSDAYALACYRYIEANPLRAGMVADAADHSWSSYRRNALGAADALISEHPVYRALGPTVEARQASYRALFRERLDDEFLATIRDATQRAWVPGSEGFRAQIAGTVGRSVDPPRQGRPPKTKPEDDGGTQPQPRLL
jgi:putative transposase